jgi:hypothetical protein
VVDRLVAPEAFDRAVATQVERVAAHPREVYAHAKAELVRDALAAVDAIPLDQELAVAALWSTDESRAARATQRRRLR